MTTPSAPRTRKRPRRTGRILLGLIALAVAGGGSWAGWKHWWSAPDDSARLQFVEVQRGNVEDLVTATGTLQPRDFVDVGAQVSGVLTRIHVEVGSEVHSGDLLAEIDPTVLQSRVDATRAQLRNQRAQLTDREASLQLAEIQHRRQRNLMAEDATTEEALQTAEANVRSARAQIEALKAQTEQTESNLRADEANLQYSRILAPMDGTVVSVSARQGQTLNANQQAPTILRIADLGTMTVQTQVSEADVGRLRPGMEVYFTTLGGTGQRWDSQLRTIEPTPTVVNNVVLYNALFEVPNENRRLMTQMTAQVFFVIAKAEDVLTVPMAALAGLAPATGRGAGGRRADAAPAGDGTSSVPVSGGRSATVRIRADDGTVQEREVRIGVTSRVAAQVVSGLNEGDMVVSGTRPASAGQAQAGQARTPR
jgi:macrolide-specific efflux system membrane fusion protein